MGQGVVSISRCGVYEPSEIASSLREVLRPLGGMKAFVSPGQRVFLKVNLLSKAVPDRAVTTHPEIVRALIREVRAAGGEPAVGDSPGGRPTAASAARLFETTGMTRVCAEEDVRLVLLDDDVVRVPAPTGSVLYSAFDLGREAVEADVLISVAKLKTHGFMMFTGAVKNLFGCIPGLEKARFHLKVPDRDDFGSMLVDLMLACRPSLAVMDAVVGMEGEGPAGGSPRHIGALLASADLVAMDVIASSMAGFDPLEVYTNKAAASRGIGPRTADEVTVVGEDWRALAPDSFARPARDIASRMPRGLPARMKQAVTARPHLARPADCTRCRECEANCPVRAIEVDRDHGPRFDLKTCIRCYCCQELCPPQAIGIRVPLLARLMDSGRR
ncbi:MAG: DUF362 domain-containing protein [Coriobacteriia bacterium]